MGLYDITPDRSHGEHEVIPELLDVIIPDDCLWSKTAKREEKWVKMARAFILRSENNPVDRFTQAAHQVGEELGVSGETVKSALRRETFGDGTRLRVPREVLIQVERQVEERDDVSIEDILQAHRDDQGETNG